MQTPFLPMSTFPGSDPDVPPVQNWYYVMVQDGPDEGPFWQWAKNAKNKTKNASLMTNSKSTLWEWHLVFKKWHRILWYMPGDENPYMHGDYGFYGDSSQSEAPQIDPTTVQADSTEPQDTISKDTTGETSVLTWVVGGAIVLGITALFLTKKS